MGKLSRKQRRFIDEYLIDCNATQAAIRAGYSPKTANEQGAKLMRKAQINEAIEEQLEKIHNEKTADAQEVLEYLTAVMRGQHTEKVLMLVGNGMQELVDIEVSAKDRIKAAELIGRRYGIFKGDFEINNAPTIIFVDGLEDGENVTFTHNQIENGKENEK